jgi:hypothetical protein
MIRGQIAIRRKMQQLETLIAGVDTAAKHSYPDTETSIG